MMSVGLSASFPAESAPAVAAALKRSMLRSERLYANWPTSFPGSLRVELATRWLLISLDHREAFLLLLAHNARSSAFALLRSIYEAWVRGLWAARAASDAQLALCVAPDRKPPKFETTAKQVSALLDAALDDGQEVKELGDEGAAALRGSFAKLRSMVWGPLSDFSHGGRWQLARWTAKDGTVAPSHPDAEVVAWLKVVDLHAVLACIALHEAAGLTTPDAVLQVRAEIAAEPTFANGNEGTEQAR